MPSLAIEMGSRDQPLLRKPLARICGKRWRSFQRLRPLCRGIKVCVGPTRFYSRVQRLASGLLAAGLKPLDRLGLWSPNYAEWTLVQYATAEIGVVLVNINPAYRTHELAYALNQSGCRF